MSSANRLFFLQFGAERVAKSLSLAGGPSVSGDDRLYWEPLMGALVDTDEGWVLLDTGMSRQAHQSAEITAGYRRGGVGMTDGPAWHLAPSPPDPDGWNWVLDGDPLVTALSGIGIGVGDLAMAAVSHLHVDHSGGIPTLAAAGVPVVIHRDELAFARSGAVGAAGGFHEPDWTAPGTVWHELDGDARLAPGVSVIATPGHTPGHQSFRVDLRDSGSWILTGDAADLAQNLLDRAPCGSCAGETSADEANATESLDKLLSIARQDGARLIPTHDQVIANAVRHPRGGHR
jgi:glyoxylase-like metal-dependent hydrolase (beta-lactamase superfamily II)